MDLTQTFYCSHLYFVNISGFKQKLRFLQTLFIYTLSLTKLHKYEFRS